ncbi:MAG: anti-sigma factor [Gemmatimonadota bacterium]|nr:anti-sigma factor [Gemmatimonadota bacterium]
MTRPGTLGSAPPAPIDCETAVRRLWDFLDGRLSTIAREEVESHLATCALCPPHFAFARTMQAGLAVSTPPSLLDAEEARLRDRVRSALRRVESDGGGSEER